MRLRLQTSTVFWAGVIRQWLSRDHRTGHFGCVEAQGFGAENLPKGLWVIGLGWLEFELVWLELVRYIVYLCICVLIDLFI